jgi:hypothetical protein
MSAKDASDAHIRGLVSLLQKAERLWEQQDERQDRLRRQLEALTREYEIGEMRLGELGLFRAELESALQSARAGQPGEEPPAMTEARTSHSRRGPVGLRGAIMEVMAARPEGPWSPQDVHVALGARQTLATARNVGHTMRKMVADEQLERRGHASYRLPAGRE